MKIEFWLLDLNYESTDGRPTIWLWGIGHDEERLLIIDEYQPYFYLLPRNGQDPIILAKKLESEKPHPSIERVLVEKRKQLTKERIVLRVYCKDVESLEKCVKQTVKFLESEGVSEHDLRPAIKYQNDHGIKPCQWYEAEVVESEIQASMHGVDRVYRLTSRPSRLQRENPPQLHAMAFSTLAVSPAGSPSPNRDPIRLISLRTSNGNETVLESTSESDKTILEGLTETIEAANPDVLFSFRGNRFQWPYLTRRAEKDEVHLSVGKGDGSPHQSLYGHFSVTGRANVDLSEFAEDIYDLKEKTLENLASYLGIKSAIRERIEETDYSKYWSDKEQRKILVESLRSETETLLEIGRDALDYVLQLSSLSGLPPDQVLTAAVGFRVDSYIMMEAHKLGQLIPSRREQPIIPYRGAIVLEPQVGLHDNVAALDFSSMYPNLMIKYNISPDTYAKDGKGDDVYVIPDVGHCFRKEPSGFYSVILSRLIQTRRATKQELAKADRGTLNYRLLKARERAIKLITNAVYGYAGWAGSRWYAREVAESAAALGRDTIQQSMSIAKKLGLKILYGDTDSLFVEYDKLKVEKFLTEIERELGLDIVLSRVYRRILFLEAKKKYAGLDDRGELEAVGMEAIRGDWSALAKEVQNIVLRTVLEDTSPAKALSYVRELAEGLESANLKVSSFIIWRTMTKPPGQYDVRAPHVEAAKKLQKYGWTVSRGDKIGYVIVKGPGKLFQKAEPYFKVAPEDIDYDYYVENQILPVASRVLSVFGIEESQILGEGSQETLSAGRKGS